MWILKLNKNKLKIILSIIMTEYIADKNIPKTDKNIGKLRTHLIGRANKMVENGELYKITKTEADEYGLKELEEIVDSMINSLKIGGIDNVYRYR